MRRLLLATWTLGTLGGCGLVLGLDEPAFRNQSEVVDPGSASEGGDPISRESGVIPEGDSGPEDAMMDAEAGVDTGTEAGADGGDSGVGCNGSAACTRTVFVTSTTYTGSNMMTTGKADQRCAERAAASSHPSVAGRKFLSWFSDGTASVKYRHVHGTSPYVLPTGVVIANNWDDLLDSQIAQTISVDELGNATSGATVVWTNTKTDGTFARTPCLGTAPGTTLVGRTNMATSEWTQEAYRSCGLEGHVYCIEL